MKCPHCGIEVRDTTTVCMYCGGKIPQRRGVVPPIMGKAADPATRPAQKTPPAERSTPAEDEGGGEEEGGLFAYLQPGEQVLIGSLNVSVKKFFFHAYLTDRRIFLIDTQEKKLKVTAKDIPLETIIENSVEFSESSDPVLVLSIRSTDEEIKTMKLVFTGNGMDRSSEVDEWVEILNEQGQPKKHKKSPAPKRPEPVPEEPEQEPGEDTGRREGLTELAGVPKEAPARTGLHPVKRPVKGHEKQPPVKRLLSLYKTEQEEEPRIAAHVPAKEPAPAEGPVKKAVPHPMPFREIPPTREPDEKAVRKVEVQSAMKGAMKGAIQPVVKTTERPVHRPVAIPAAKKPVPADVESPVPPPSPAEDLSAHEEPAGDDAAGPLFCQNCGKKLPASANFCPGCGTKITAHKEKHAPLVRERSPRRHDDSDRQKTGEQPHPVKPPAKKAPKGSEMTILHKFLRR